MSYLEKALEMFNKGFNSESAKKKAISLLLSQYERETGTMSKFGIMAVLLSLNDRPDSFDTLYWGIPSFHNWNEKHSEMYHHFPAQVERIEELVRLRAEFKKAEIIKKEKSEIAKKTEKIQKSLREELDRLKTQYIEGMNLAEIVGPNVTANVHLVHGHKGTIFVRAFYYLNGEFMSLNMILAILDELKRKGKK